MKDGLEDVYRASSLDNKTPIVKSFKLLNLFRITESDVLGILFKAKNRDTLAKKKIHFPTIQRQSRIARAV